MIEVSATNLDDYREHPRATPTEIDTRVDALTAAVQHHGLSMRAPNAIPAGAETVLATAKKFEGYINTGIVPDKPEKHNHR